MILVTPPFCFQLVFAFFRFVGLFVLAGFFVGWLVDLCLRWFRVCFQRLVILDFVLLVVWERCSSLLVAVSVRKPERVGLKKPERVSYNNPKGSVY